MDGIFLIITKFGWSLLAFRFAGVCTSALQGFVIVLNEFWVVSEVREINVGHRNFRGLSLLFTPLPQNGSNWMMVL